MSRHWRKLKVTNPTAASSHSGSNRHEQTLTTPTWKGDLVVTGSFFKGGFVANHLVAGRHATLTKGVVSIPASELFAQLEPLCKRWLRGVVEGDVAKRIRAGDDSDLPPQNLLRAKRRKLEPDEDQGNGVRSLECHF